jgi:hypothetical protein
MKNIIIMVVVCYLLNLAKLHEILDISALKKKLSNINHHRENSDFSAISPLVLPEISRKHSNNSTLIKTETKNIRDLKFRKINW